MRKELKKDISYFSASTVKEERSTIPSAFWFWENIIVVATIFTILPLFLSLYALIGIPSSTFGIILYINPIIAFTLAMVYFGEKVDTHKLAAYFRLLLSVFNWSIIKDISTFKHNNR
ncbi:EamA domain-containing membrane protein RarD [Pedobacter sp. UYP24]